MIVAVSYWALVHTVTPIYSNASSEYLIAMSCPTHLTVVEKSDLICLASVAKRTDVSPSEFDSQSQFSNCKVKTPLDCDV